MAYFTHEVFQTGNLFSCRITVYGIAFGQRLRFFLRRSATNTLERDDLLTASGNPFQHTFYDLTGNTEYAVNVGLVSSGDIVDVYLGLQTFTTGVAADRDLQTRGRTTGIGGAIFLRERSSQSPPTSGTRSVTESTRSGYTGDSGTCISAMSTAEIPSARELSTRREMLSGI